MTLSAAGWARLPGYSSLNEKVFRAKIQHQNEFLAFLTFDEAPPARDLRRRGDGSQTGECRLRSFGYGFASFGDLVATYERLKAEGIPPFLPLNHLFPTSLYYHCPLNTPTPMKLS